MPEPYKARVDVRRFLNFPGFHDGAYIVAYVEDTRPRRIDAARSRRSFPSDPVPVPAPSSRSQTVASGSTSSSRSTASCRFRTRSTRSTRSCAR